MTNFMFHYYHWKKYNSNEKNLVKSHEMENIQLQVVKMFRISKFERLKTLELKTTLKILIIKKQIMKNQMFKKQFFKKENRVAQVMTLISIDIPTNKTRDRWILSRDRRGDEVQECQQDSRNPTFRGASQSRPAFRDLND